MKDREENTTVERFREESKREQREKEKSEREKKAGVRSKTYLTMNNWSEVALVHSANDRMQLTKFRFNKF